MSYNKNNNSCVETPVAPAWLYKLEDRRENLKRGKLGHEAGAGSPCIECGDKCPGLDLHFWRKLCRNCKCRKDQHLCPDDDNATGWAQFEVLGQIRSKPAFMKIKAFASQAVQLEWVPPNATPDVISDYMEKLGTAKIPVKGSDAAQKRKQQLVFQVPPHDLDAALCDNLTESEIDQLQQYVKKLRENCVGQGSVVRLKEVNASLDNLASFIDPFLNEILANKRLCEAIEGKAITRSEVLFNDVAEPLSKASPLSESVVQSLVQSGPVYDKMLAILKTKKVDFCSDPKLSKISDFREEYLNNPEFKRELDKKYLVNSNETCSPLTPNKQQSDTPSLPFHSPLPVKNAIRAGIQQQQATPIRKVNFNDIGVVLNACSFPTNVDYNKDAVFSNILNSSELKDVFQGIEECRTIKPVVILKTPLVSDYVKDPLLSTQSKQALNGLPISVKVIQSCILNEPFYERLFMILKEKGIDFGRCHLLASINKLLEVLNSNPALFEELYSYAVQMPTSNEICYSSIPNNVYKMLTNSGSHDSGFDSKPSTPSSVKLFASTGKQTIIPGTEEIYKHPRASAATLETLPEAIHNLQLQSENIEKKDSMQPPLLKCRDCEGPIFFGEVAVKAERAGKEAAWHPDCFKCCTCRELLADLVYFFYNGRVYCGRDLALKLKIPRCKACDELIFTKEYTAAENSTFHIKHFCCYHCDTPLAGQQYIPDENSNMPLCLKCYNVFFAAACNLCNQTIGPTDQGVTFSNLHWHDSCFLCAGVECGKSLIGGRFCIKQEKPFCSPACVRSIIK